MSDSSDQQEGSRVKKRARKRSCDVCRSKKIRCDGPEKKSHEKCTNCQELGTACTYVEQAKRRGPPKGYVDQLEHRMMRLEATLKRLHPETDFIGTVGPALDKDTFVLSTHLSSLQGLHIPPLPALNLPRTSASSSRTFVNSPGSAANSPSASASTPPCRVHSFAVDWTAREKDSHLRRGGSNNKSPEAMNSDCDEHHTREHVKMVQEFANLQATEEHKEDHYRYHGKSSGVQLVQAVRDLKKTAAGGADGFVQGLVGSRRREYWTIPSWEIGISNESVNPPDLSKWPSPDLAASLIDAYFRHCNPEYPVLNRVIFQKRYRAEHWRHHHDFTKVVLMVFANGARYVDDPRVYFKSPSALDNNESLDGTVRHSAGWKYMQAVVKMGKSWLSKPDLHDLQAHVLFCTFMQGSAIPHMTWRIAGMGLGLSQDLGVHLRAGVAHMEPVERELCIRAFWCLYHIDRVTAAAIGRAVAMQDTDFDAEFPLAVDDEYWETGNPATDFIQPSGTTARISSFICALRLDHIIECALKTIYAVGRTTAQLQEPETQKAMVAELDSSLNAWADAVPDCLRWDPSRRDEEVFERSAVLYAQYYFVQILVHRTFIPTPRRPTNTGFPSLAICSSASRAISNILDAVLRRSRQMPGSSRGVPVSLQMPAFTAVVVLLIGVWGGRKPGSSSESEKALRDVKKCLRAIKDMEPVWRQAGKMTDVLTELASAANMPVETSPANAAPTPTTKRTRDGCPDSNFAQSASQTSNPAFPFTSQSYYPQNTVAGGSLGSAPQQQNNAPGFIDMSPPTFPFSFSPQPTPQSGFANNMAFDDVFMNSLFSNLNSDVEPGFGVDPASSLLHGYGGADLASCDSLPPTLSPRVNGHPFTWPGLPDIPATQMGRGQTLDGWSAYGIADDTMGVLSDPSQLQPQP